MIIFVDHLEQCLAHYKKLVVIVELMMPVMHCLLPIFVESHLVSSDFIALLTEGVFFMPYLLSL